MAPATTSRVERGLKLTAIMLSGAAVVGAVVAGRPNLSSTAGSAACFVLALAALGWVLVRTARQGGFAGPGGGLLVDRTKSERRQLRRARRHPDQVPENLTPLARRYAAQQAHNNDRSGWLNVALVLFNAPSLAETQTHPDVVRLILVAVLVGLGIAADHLGLLWRRTETTLRNASPRGPAINGTRH